MAEASLHDRGQILAIARTWIGTPYRHQASVRGAGTDCLGVLRGVYAEICGAPAEQPPAYQPDWYDLGKKDLLLDKAFQYLDYLGPSLDCAAPADVLVFRLREDMAAKHCGILAENGRMIHARVGRSVEEVTVGGWFERRIVGVFSFPGIGGS